MSFSKPSELANELTKMKGIVGAAHDTLDWYKEVSKGGGANNVSNWGRKHFQQGKIYIFNYDPKTKSRLEFYDRNPMVLSLGQLRNKGEEGTLDFGINLHFVPRKMREKLLDLTYDTNRTQIEKEIDSKTRRKAEDQTPLQNVNYQAFNRFLSGHGFEFAFRSYYPGRRTNVYVLPYQDWYKTTFLQQEDVVGATIQQIYSEFSSAQKSGRITSAFSRVGSAARRFFNN